MTQPTHRRNRPLARMAGNITALPHRLARHAYWRLGVRDFTSWEWTILMWPNQPPPRLPRLAVV